MNSRVILPREAIEAFCRKWMIARLELFGSVLREDFRDDSDVDFLVTFDPESQSTGRIHQLEFLFEPKE